jgi:hypothetical protein
MVSPLKEVSSAAENTKQSAEATLAELRDQVTSLAKDVADIAERRTRAAREAVVEGAETGAKEVRKAIRRQPAIAMAVSVAAGAALALLLVPRFSRPAQSRWDRFERWTPNVTRADLYDMADNIQRSVSRAASAAAAPVTPAFERMVEALSRADTSAVSSLMEKAGGWFTKAQEKAKEKMR